MDTQGTHNHPHTTQLRTLAHEELVQLCIKLLNEVSKLDAFRKDLAKQTVALQERVTALGEDNALLKEQNQKLNEALYGKKSEKSKNTSRDSDAAVTDEQGPVFNEAEAHAHGPAVAENEEEPAAEPGPAPKNKKKKDKKRRKSPLSGVKDCDEENYDLNPGEKTCPHHGTDMKKIGTKSTHKLHYVAGHFRKTTRNFCTYKCDACSQEGEEHIVRAQGPEDIFAGSYLTPSLIAMVIVAKFMDGLPLHRLQVMFQRQGVEITRANLARWIIRAANLVKDLVQLMHEDLLQRSVLQCDETPVQVLKESGRNPSSKSYMWVLTSQGAKPAILYHYETGRGLDAALAMLKGFKGTLMVDGLATYVAAAKQEGFALGACLAHCRRGFFQTEKAVKALAPDANASPILQVTSQVMAWIQQLYAIENEAKDFTPQERLRLRREKSKPILDALQALLAEQKDRVLPKSLLGKAIHYTLQLWPRLLLILEEGELPLDNNFTEAQIRVFVLGRKAWLFCDTPEGAHASASLYSLVQTAKLNGIEPGSYLNLLFKELVTATNDEGKRRLLPYNVRDHFPVDSYTPPA